MRMALNLFDHSRPYCDIVDIREVVCKKRLTADVGGARQRLGIVWLGLAEWMSDTLGCEKTTDADISAVTDIVTVKALLMEVKR